MPILGFTDNKMDGPGLAYHGVSCLKVDKRLPLPVVLAKPLYKAGGIK